MANFEPKSQTRMGILLGIIIGLLSVTGSGAEEYQTAALKKHNEYRAMHQVGDMTLNEELNNLAIQCAQYYAKKNTIDHSCSLKTMSNGKKAGENLYISWGASKSDVEEAEQATINWYNEVKDYKFSQPGFAMNTGHFTQVVWKESTELGVGIAREGNNCVVTALYYVHGNMMGDFEKNVFPAKGGKGGIGRDGQEGSDAKCLSVHIPTMIMMMLIKEAMCPI